MIPVVTPFQRRAVLTLIVVTIAFLCGHLMQSNAPGTKEASVTPTLPSPPEETSDLASLQPAILPGRAREAKRFTRRKAAIDQTCAPFLALSALPGAMLSVELETCTPNAPVTLRHAGVTFDLISDQSGHLSTQLPAFEVDSLISTAFGATTLKETVTQPQATAFQHVALQWDGDQVLNMHAYEFGAKPKHDGHVWSGSPASSARASKGHGGFLTRLGNGSGRSAEIYSFPVDTNRASGVVRLVVEAEVTPETCNREVQALALQNGPLNQLSETRVALKMPPCEAVGQVVRLQNLLQDMRLSQR